MKPSRRTTGVLLALTAAAALGLGTHASKKPETIGNVYVNGNTRDVVAALHNELNGKLNGTIDKTVTVIGSDSATTNAFANEFETTVAVTANDLNNPKTRTAFEHVLEGHTGTTLENLTLPVAIKQTKNGAIVASNYNPADKTVIVDGYAVPIDLLQHPNEYRKITTLQEFNTTLEDALRRKEPSFLLIGTDWCHYCDVLADDLKRDSNGLQNVVLAKLKTDDAVEAVRKVNARVPGAFYRLEVPSLLVINSNGAFGHQGYDSSTGLLGPGPKLARDASEWTQLKKYF